MTRKLIPPPSPYWQAVPLAVAAIILLPVGLGLVLTLEASFADRAAWSRLLATPGLARSLMLTLWVGFAATLLSLGIARLVLSRLVADGLSATGRLGALLAPLLAAPHAALAIGLAFLIAPSGWPVRLLSPWLTGWERPPDWLLPGDPLGLSLIAGLVLKETAFLIFAGIAALGSMQPQSRIALALSLGYGRHRGFAVAVWPDVLRRLALPLAIVLSYGLSAVDAAQILGPQLPPTLPVQVYRWLLDTDPLLRAQGAAGAGLIVALVAASLGLAALALRCWQRHSARSLAGPAPDHRGLIWPGRLLPPLLGGIGAGALLILVLWALAGRWRFPEALPGSWSAALLLRDGESLWATGGVTLAIALITAALSLLFGLAGLEAERRRQARHWALSPAVLFLPLILPQIGYSFGLYRLLLWLGIDGGEGAVVLAHLPIALPYLWLVLAGPWRLLGDGPDRMAAAIGLSPLAVLLRVRLPLLKPSLLAAAALAFAVSIDLYLPTAFAGAGRVQTLATEAVTRASGADRRIAAGWGLAQTVPPAAGFAAAMLLARKRRFRRPA